MSNIAEIKKYELEEIQDFLDGIEEYGHIYHYPPERLDAPFNKILEGIKEIRDMMTDSWSM